MTNRIRVNMKKHDDAIRAERFYATELKYYIML